MIQLVYNCINACRLAFSFSVTHACNVIVFFLIESSLKAIHQLAYASYYFRICEFSIKTTSRFYSIHIRLNTSVYAKRYCPKPPTVFILSL